MLTEILQEEYSTEITVNDFECIWIEQTDSNGKTSAVGFSVNRAKELVKSLKRLIKKHEQGYVK